MLTVKLLNTPELIIDAAALLHQVYIEELQWQFAEDNPSYLRVETHDDGRNVLLDRFTDNAVWFGAFDGKELIGCMRLTSVDTNNKFELESYPSSKIVHKYLPPRDSGVELSKIAVQGKYAGQGVVKRMWLAAFKYTQAHNLSVICCTHNGYLKNIFKRIGFPLKMEHAFKYEPSDPLPVNIYVANSATADVTNMIYTLECLDGDLSTNSYKIFQALEIVAPILPVPTYWHDTDGVVLGINEHCLNKMGSIRDNIVGKSPYEFYPEHTAEHILSHNNQVIRSGEVMTQEEWIKDITTGATKCFSSTKAPLYDDEGTIIGLIGSFVEITGEKEAERLRLENEVYKVEKTLQHQYKTIVDQVAHDIRSPVASLDMLIGSCGNNLDEADRIAIKQAITRISDIASNLLSYFKPQEYPATTSSNSNTQKIAPALASSDLLDILTEKRYEYSKLPIEFISNFSMEGYFSFININSTTFKRSISNLINNSVEAIKGKAGKVTLHLETCQNEVKVTVEDNGSGIPDKIRQKILNSIEVTDGKKNGYGIGFNQIRKMLEENKGILTIESTVGIGTKVVMTFPKTSAPEWMADNIQLKTGDLIVILDDDPSIHKAWEKKFKNSAPNILRKHFEHGSGVVEFLNKLTEDEKKKVFLLTDYELLKQDLHGLNVVDKTKIERSILVTSHHNNPGIRDLAKLTNTKILPKSLASEIQINISNSW